MSKKNKLIELKVKKVEYKNKKLYGMNTMDDDELSDTSEFLLASITKLFTILSLLLLQQNKQLDIHDNIGKYLNYNYIKNLKILDIINHTSGLKPIFTDYDSNSSKIKYKSVTEVYEKLNDNNMLDEKLNGTFVYSNMGYQILGVLIEKLSGITYFDFVKKYILIPLEMNNTGSGDYTNIILYNGDSKKLNKFNKWGRTVSGSADGLKSCVKDLIKFTGFIKLLDKPIQNLLNELYIYKENKDDIIIQHTGSIVGGKSFFGIKYDKNYKCKDIFISLETIIKT